MVVLVLQFPCNMLIVNYCFIRKNLEQLLPTCDVMDFPQVLISKDYLRRLGSNLIYQKIFELRRIFQLAPSLGILIDRVCIGVCRGEDNMCGE